VRESKKEKKIMKTIICNDRQKKLLAKLVDDTCSTLPENERGIEKVSIEALLWNLFKSSKYDYSLKDVRFIIDSKLNS
jgi:hypothetical protein